MTSSYSTLINDGIFLIDTGFGRPRFDASYLVVDSGCAAFIDTGTNHSVPRLLASLAEQGLDAGAVVWVILTHVHLDHAGGAGLLMQSLPNARLVVHPRGVRHMVDPTKLVEGARAVYGDAAMHRDYGDVHPVREDRVLSTWNGMVLDLADRPLRFLDTPGHARHHNCIWDEASRGWFTGDTFGLCYPEFDLPQGRFVLPTTSPVQFDPVALRDSLTRLLDVGPKVIYPTHYGPFGEASRMADLFVEQLDRMVAAATDLATAPDRHRRLIEAFRRIHWDALSACGWTGTVADLDDVLAVDLELNAQGVAVWLDGLKT